MRFQLLSDLHLETETFEPTPAPDAELLLLAGDIDSRWTRYELFRDWPVPVLAIAGNHEFDGRELSDARPALLEHLARLNIELLECESAVKTDGQGRRIRFVGTTRWCDFDLFGAVGRERAMRAGRYFMKVMRATHQGQPFDADGVREEALVCGDWLKRELEGSPDSTSKAWDATVVLTHFAPSARSADSRYGLQPGTASFCNADDALLAHADLWIHGHLHCRHDYLVTHEHGETRVLCNARGHAHRGEAEGHRPLKVFEI